MKPCRECTREISEQAVFCPGCGAPYPARDECDGWGFEHKSEATILGLPFLHISFKYRSNRRPVPGKGFIAIGQFAYGIVTISQFGMGVFSVSQFTIAGFALARWRLHILCWLNSASTCTKAGVNWCGVWPIFAIASFKQALCRVVRYPLHDAFAPYSPL